MGDEGWRRAALGSTGVPLPSGRGRERASCELAAAGAPASPLPSSPRGERGRDPPDRDRPARRRASAPSPGCPPAASRSPRAPPAGRPPPRCRACISCRAPARPRSRRTAPSIRTRVKPAFCHSASSLRYSPLRPRTTGASRIEPRALGQRHRPVDHLADRLRRDRLAGGGRVGHADPGPQQAHVIVDLGDGGDGRARVARRRLLLDRDGRREALDMVDVGLLHHLEELARIGATATRRSAAAPRHRWCRRRARTCPSPTGR